MSKRKHNKDKLAKTVDRVEVNPVIDDDDDDDDYPMTCEDVFGACMGPSCPGFCSDCIEY